MAADTGGSENGRGRRIMKHHRTLSRHVDQHTMAAALVAFALFGALGFVLVCFFFAPS
jgi:hypothetical protein